MQHPRAPRAHTWESGSYSTPFFFFVDRSPFSLPYPCRPYPCDQGSLCVLFLDVILHFDVPATSMPGNVNL